MWLAGAPCLGGLLKPPAGVFGVGGVSLCNPREGKMPLRAVRACWGQFQVSFEGHGSFIVAVPKGQNILTTRSPMSILNTRLAISGLLESIPQLLIYYSTLPKQTLKPPFIMRTLEDGPKSPETGRLCLLVRVRELTLASGSNHILDPPAI